MHKAMQKITQELENEIQCYRELLDVVTAERDILLSGDHKRLAETAEQKISLSNRLARAQEARRKALQTLAPRSAKQPAKLSDLTPLLPVDRQAEFKAAVREAGTLAQRLSQMNTTNRRYLEEALDTVDHLLAILTGQGQGHIYGSNGVRRNAPSRSMVTREV